MSCEEPPYDPENEEDEDQGERMLGWLMIGAGLLWLWLIWG